MPLNRNKITPEQLRKQLPGVRIALGNYGICPRCREPYLTNKRRGLCVRCLNEKDLPLEQASLAEISVRWDIMWEEGRVGDMIETLKVLKQLGRW